MSSSQPLTGLTNPRHPTPQLTRSGELLRVQFQAMASDCEILFDLPPAQTGQAPELARIAVQEVWRIEEKIQSVFARQRFRPPASAAWPLAGGG